MTKLLGYRTTSREFDPRLLELPEVSCHVPWWQSWVDLTVYIVSQHMAIKTTQLADISRLCWVTRLGVSTHHRDHHNPRLFCTRPVGNLVSCSYLMRITATTTISLQHGCRPNWGHNLSSYMDFLTKSSRFMESPSLDSKFGIIYRVKPESIVHPSAALSLFCSVQ